MYCNKCGTKNPDSARFCSNCGEILVETGALEKSAGVAETPARTPSFPFAGIFLIFHGLLSLYRGGFDYYSSTTPVFVGIFGSFFRMELLQAVLIVILVILLFWKRMRKSTLILLLGHSVWGAVTCVYIIHYSSLMAGRIAHPELSWGFGPLYIEILSYIALFLFVVLCLQKADSPSGKKLWFIPGVLNCIELIWLLFLGRYHIMSIILSPVVLLCMAIENFLLGWWLFHPYREQRVYEHRSTSPPTAQKPVTTSPSGVIDAPSFGYAALGFFFPMVGLILYLVWREQTPLRAKSAGKGALIGAIALVVLTVVWTVFSNFLLLLFI